MSNPKPPGSRGAGAAGSRNRTAGNNGIRAKSNGRQGPMGMGVGSGKYLQNAAPSQNKESNISADVVNYLKDELLATWEAYLIPDYHRTVFLDCIFGLKPQQYAPIMVKEIEDLQNEKSPIQNTIRAIIARESCISQITELEKVLRETDEKNLQLLSLGVQHISSQN